MSNKKFILEVPEGDTECSKCPWWDIMDICQYLRDNSICSNLDFSKCSISEPDSYTGSE